MNLRTEGHVLSELYCIQQCQFLPATLCVLCTCMSLKLPYPGEDEYECAGEAAEEGAVLTVTVESRRLPPVVVAVAAP